MLARCWDLKTRDALWQIIPPLSRRQMYIPVFLHALANIYATSGYAALSHNARYLLVSNMNIGMNLYTLGEKEPLQSFLQPTNTGINFPLGVSFLHGGRAVVCGSQTGSVKIWETLSGEHLQTLEHKGICIILLVGLC